MSWSRYKGCFALIIAGLLWVGATRNAAGQDRNEANQNVEWLDFDQALAAARDGDKVILVYVEAAWCAACHRMEVETFASPAVTARLSDFVLARLRFDDNRTMLADESRQARHRIRKKRLLERASPPA